MRRALAHFTERFREHLFSEASAEARASEPEGLLRGESGTAMVEFALFFWPQLVLTLAILQFALLQYGYLIVQQAADLGARAAAVYDLPGSISADDAARRMVARQCAVLAPGVQESTGIEAGTFSGGSTPAEGELSWNSADGKLGFTPARGQQVYALLKEAKTTRAAGEITCDVTFEYVLQIPVGAQFLVGLNDIARGRSSGDYTIWPIKRSGRSVAPWIR